MALVIPNKRVLALRLRDPALVTEALSKFQVVPGEAFGVTGSIVGVPHRNETMTVLRNQGIDVRGYEPIRSYYRYPKLRGKFDPMQHQERTAEFFTTHPKCFCLSEQRTGKSCSVIWAADFMKRERDVSGVLIIATMSCINTVWRDEIFNLTPGRSVAVLHGSAAKRRDLLNKRFDYYVINHDGIKVIGDELRTAIANGRINLVVVDETAEFGDSRTDKYDVLKSLCDTAPRVWCLTGTPMSKGPEPVWAQARLVNEANVPEFITHWKYLTMLKINKFKWIPRKDAKEKVHAALQPAIRFAKRDVIKALPPLTIQDIEVEPTAQQRAMVKELKKQGALRLTQGTMTVANAAVMLGKAMQIFGGCVKMDDGTVLEVDHAPRLIELLRLINGTERKWIVLCSHRAMVDLLCKSLMGKHKHVWIDGRVTGKNRDNAVHAYTHDDSVRGLIAHPKTISHGLELSVADTIVWWSPTHSAELYAQANERMASAAQRFPMGVYHLGSSPVEWSVYRTVSGNLDLQKSTLDLFKEFVSDA